MVTAPKHGISFVTHHRVLTAVSLAIIAFFAFSATFAAASFLDIDSTVQSHAVPILSPSKGTSTPTTLDQYAGKTLNILILGQDTRSDSQNAAIGGSDGAGDHQSDTAMVMQISADRSYVNLVSIPRDSLVDAPSCKTTTGTIPARYNVMFNSIFAYGYSQGGDVASAANCAMTAVNALTGLDISSFIVADFAGLQDMIDAIGGVSVCIPEDTKDSYTNLSLTRGLQHLNGTQATQYARMRHGTGTDGSDIMRTTRQQYLVKALLATARSKSLFTNASQMYQLAKSALSSLQFSENLATTTGLVGLATSLKNLTTSHIYSQTLPVTSAPSDPNRVIWASTASSVWAKFKESQPLVSSAATESNSSGSSDGSSSDSSSSSDASSSTPSASSSTGASSTPSATVNANTGLITESDGTLIDPETGGTVDPESGAIRDPNTGQYIGMAAKYINFTVCGITAQDWD
ncbi:LCP family protein [Bifidobacterium aquikefiricola]|uniref:LCP family protein n=1 Tax=Bifidobacterium aquikefiricola TaxID=3059038 RepID=A0AB39U928_9BIFI